VHGSALQSKYGGIEVNEAAAGPVGKNAKLKRLLPDRMLDNAALKRHLGKSGESRCSPRSSSPSERRL
jgi:hypothetical protein